MLSQETEHKLVQIFITISVGEEKINKLKQDILAKYNINPIHFFFKLNKNNSIFITKNDISAYLNSFSIVYTPTDIDYIFYFYDKDFDNTLNFYEFLDLLISDSNYLFKKSFKKRYKHNKIDINEINCEIDINIQKSVLQIFIEEIELARQLNDLIIDIKHNKDFVIQNIFYEIKSYSYITYDSLKAFFDRNEVSYNDTFIKNIFIRFINKELNGRISFNKFKNLFELPYNKNVNENVNTNLNTINNNFIPNQISPIINQSQISDINLDNSNISDMKFNNFNFNDNFNINVINNNNYVNEEDIQFECSHLSGSGSVESKKEKDNNCGYVSKNNLNFSYKNYLREKRSKSLEKNLSRSLSPNTKTENQKINDKNKKDIRNIRVINDNNNSINEGINLSNSVSSFNDDISMKLPIRLNKNLVKRQLPKRKNNNQNQTEYHFTYGNNNNEKKYSFIHHYNKNIIKNESDKENQQCNHNIEEKRSSNILDLKVYKEDFGNRINGSFEKHNY